MFSRRHPFLYSFLIFTAITAGTLIILSMLFTAGTQKQNAESGEKVGVVEINGVISDSKEIIEQLKRFRENKAIKAVLVRINSPGGVVGPSQEIYREIQKTIEVKKVVASMGSVAASGGYYAAAAANGIMANPGTITGSIGVIMGYTNFRNILEKIGLVPVVFKSGEFKDIGSPARTMSEEEREILQNFVDKIHRQFVADVAAGRHMDPAEVARLADGRIYSGEEAQALGLVDRLGNLEDAIEWAGRTGGIKGKITPVYIQEKRFPILKYLKESSLSELTNLLIHPSLFAGYLYRPDGQVP